MGSAVELLTGIYKMLDSVPSTTMMMMMMTMTVAAAVVVVAVDFFKVFIIKKYHLIISKYTNR